MDPLNAMVALFLAKMTAIEAQLRDLPTVKSQLQDLSSIGPQLAALEARMSVTSEALTSSLTELRQQQVNLDARVAELETRPVSVTPNADMRRLEFRLDALEQVSRSSELILSWVIETPSKNLKTIFSNIAFALSVEDCLDYIVGCFCIPAKGDHPCPLVVRLSLR